MRIWIGLGIVGILFLAILGVLIYMDRTDGTIESYENNGEEEKVEEEVEKVEEEKVEVEEKVEEEKVEEEKVEEPSRFSKFLSYLSVLNPVTGIARLFRGGGGEWKTGEWNDCDVDCGGGSQTREVVCEPESATCPNEKPSHTQECNIQPCPEMELGNWQIGEWGQCSADCGGGVRTRTVECIPAGVKCLEPMPPTSEPCNTQKCGPKWTEFLNAHANYLDTKLISEESNTDKTSKECQETCMLIPECDLVRMGDDMSCKYYKKKSRKPVRLFEYTGKNNHKVYCKPGVECGWQN